MTTNPLNICPSCEHIKTCVLTKFKELVWSCSEYDEAQEESQKTGNVEPESQLGLVRNKSKKNYF